VSKWCLTRIEIEGFRGINNEGDPFVLDLSCDKVNSISAPNAVGKSSIYEAVCLALRGGVPRLDELHSSEKAAAYYVNRFYNGQQATVRLSLEDLTSGAESTVTVRRGRDGATTVSSVDHADPQALMRSLDREFVLLDYNTLHAFMRDSPLARGRSFSKLLGLAEYSNARSRLRAVSNTQAFNNHFGLNTLTQRIIAAKKGVSEARVAAYKAVAGLCDVKAEDLISDADADRVVLDFIKNIPTLQCIGQATDLASVNFSQCFSAISEAEGGEERKKYVELTQQIAEAEKISVGTLTGVLLRNLVSLAEEYELSLTGTAGVLRQQLLEQSRAVLESDTWVNPQVCPTCEQTAPFPVLDLVTERLAQYAAADAAAAKLKLEWSLVDWTPVQQLEAKVKTADEAPLFAQAVSQMAVRCASAATLSALEPWLETLQARHQAALESCKSNAEALAEKLPSSLVGVTKSVAEAKAIHEKLKDAAVGERKAAELEGERKDAERIKSFLDKATEIFSVAEGAASKARMEAVLPLVQQLFCSIMTDQVVPRLQKDSVGEDLKLVLDRFWTETDVDALPVLSESYKNALAISIFMAAAKLYSGPPRFLLLDDITSSFDGGSQFFPMQVIREYVARPKIPDGLQLIILSHDPLLEKYFIRAAEEGDWQHRRVQGSPKTLLMVADDTGNALRSKLIKMLDAGLTDNVDAGVRQYLECKLLYIIQRVRINVPLDFAMNDNKKMVQNATDTIKQQVALYKQIGTLVLTGPQEAAVSTTIASIIGNFMAHYATGSSGAIGEAGLRATIKAVDDLEDCFKYVDASGQKRFFKALDKKS
jgi:hypothetical protein